MKYTSLLSVNRQTSINTCTHPSLQSRSLFNDGFPFFSTEGFYSTQQQLNRVKASERVQQVCLYLSKLFETLVLSSGLTGRDSYVTYNLCHEKLDQCICLQHALFLLGLVQKKLVKCHWTTSPNTNISKASRRRCSTI